MADYKALVVGAGRMGAFFDKPGDPWLLSHAHAYVEHPRFDLAGFVDSDLEKAGRAAALWGGVAFKTVEEAFSRIGRIDVVSVCVPPPALGAEVEALGEKNTGCLILEKPLGPDLASAERTAGLIYRGGVPAIVNYSRRFVPELAGLRRRVSSGAFGRFAAGHASYCKGVLANGSHAVDLLRYMVGEVGAWKVISGGPGSGPDDPTVTASLSMPGGGVFQLIGTPHDRYFTFEAELFFERGRVRIEDAGLDLIEYEVEADPLWPDYGRLVEKAKSRTSLDRALHYLVDNAAGVLGGSESPVCSVEDALAAQRICAGMRDDFNRMEAGG